MVKQSKMGESTEQNRGGVEKKLVNFLAAAVSTSFSANTPEGEIYSALNILPKPQEEIVILIFKYS